MPVATLSHVPVRGLPLVVAFFAALVLAEPGSAQQGPIVDDPVGAYTEPAPKAQPDEKAAEFVKKSVKRAGGGSAPTSDALRQGVVLEPSSEQSVGSDGGPGQAGAGQRAAGNKPRTRPPSPDARASARPRSNATAVPQAKGRAVSAPADERVPSGVLGFVLAGLLTGVGVMLELVPRLRARRQLPRRAAT